MTISEKVAYLKGLAEGLELDTENSKEGKLISVMIGVLEEVAMSLEDLEEDTEALCEEVDALNDSVSDLEEFLVGDDEDDDDMDEDDFIEAECPKCGAPLVIDEDVLLQGNIQCPNCKEQFAIDFNDCDEEGCDCHGHDQSEK
ncbi:MAG: hypothetical protein LIO58_01940 [Oscillospiraceae bacterium]|nr:hypothetical protein [Oscillospiraceae bacterium]